MISRVGAGVNDCDKLLYLPSSFLPKSIDFVRPKFSLTPRC